MPNEVEIKITADDLTGPGFASVLAKMMLLKKMAKEISSAFSPDIKTGDMTSTLITLKQKMQSLGIADIADINQSPGKITSQLMLLRRLIQQAGISDLLDIDVNDSKIEAALSRVKGLVEDNPIRIDTQFQPFKAPYKAFGPGSQNMYSEFMKRTSDWEVVTPEQMGRVSAFIGELGALRAAASGAMGSGSGDGGGGSGILGLAAASAFFGKHFQTNFAGWRTAIGGVALWHIALDAAIEGTIIAVSSFAALAAAAEALGGSAVNLYTQLTAVYKVNSALGSKIPPLTDRFFALQKALAPQAIEIYGGALNAINMEAGSMGHALVPVTNLFTTFIAKFDLWLKGFGSTGKIFTAGIGFLDQLGHIFGTLGMSIANLLKDDPGIARYLLDLIQGLADLLNMITKLPGPLVQFALLLHGAYVWGSVLAGLIGRLAGSFVGLYKILFAIGSNPLGWVAIAAAGLIYLGYAANQADSATKNFIATQNSQLQQLSGMQAFQQSIVDVSQAFQEMKAQNWQSVVNNMSNLSQTGTRAGYVFDNLASGLGNFIQLWSHSHIMTGLKEIGRAFGGIFNSSPFSHVAQNNIDAYLQQINKLNQGQIVMIKTFERVRQMGFTVAQSWALLSLAGVKVGDSVQVAVQKVENLITGYKALSIQGSTLANSVDAITFQGLQQQSQITALTGAWSNFFSLISNGESGFVTFAQALANVHGKMTGLTAASLTNRQNFLQAAQAAQTEMNNLTMLASAAGLGAHGQDLLRAATRDMLQQLLPAAKGSQAFTSILYALAQQGGYQGADSFKALSTWIGRTEHPMTKLDNITTTLTGDAAGLTKDVQALSDALGQTLSSAMSTAIFAATGGQKKFDDFANALTQAHGNLGKMESAAKSFIPSLYQITGNASAAKNEFIVFAGALGLTKKQADVLWQNSLPTLQGTINKLHGANVRINSNISAQQQALNAYQISLNNINGMSAQVYINQTTVDNTVQGTSGGTGGRRKRAGGGYASGRTIVGENGWEMVDLPAGSYVHSNSESQRMANSWGGGSGVVTHIVKVDVTGAEKDMKNLIKKWVNVDGGGDVQSAFGDGN